jgi:lipopolysaccharide/colanic/teichoic acid biosynthesis glycosyltransferase
MSLVGPRPALPAEVEQFDDALHARHRLKPGVTGLWQIEARDNPSFYAYRHLDLFYVENSSPLFDLAILLRTIPSVLVRTVRPMLGRGVPPEPQKGAATT